ncbi:MAG: triphosphoribosyl-dephospho-CoA synthase [Planctomycetaceae bacterium]|nr:triphosphoribosyl-dephospho-CoA synthase [Planctomycetaceae bacterium]
MTLWQMQLAKWIRFACVAEVLSPKPGNVNPTSSFGDTNVHHFLQSADVISPLLAVAETQPVGRTILNAVTATNQQVGRNTNLGIILLLAPLAKVPPHQSLSDGVVTVLDRMTVVDSDHIYQAIRLVSPGGLGDADEQDVSQAPSLPFRECMRLAADRDLIAAEYAHGFPIVLSRGIELLREVASSITNQLQQVTALAIRLLAEFHDSLIVRKCGSQIADEARQRARGVLKNDWPHSEDARLQLAELDAFLRDDGNRRNPGTTADLIAAILFSAQREGWWTANEDFWESYLAESGIR